MTLHIQLPQSSDDEDQNNEIIILQEEPGIKINPRSSGSVVSGQTSKTFKKSSCNKENNTDFSERGFLKTNSCIRSPTTAMRQAFIGEES
jgi:hypothetical protein